MPRIAPPPFGSAIAGGVEAVELDVRSDAGALEAAGASGAVTCGEVLVLSRSEGNGAYLNLMGGTGCWILYVNDAWLGSLTGFSSYGVDIETPWRTSLMTSNSERTGDALGRVGLSLRHFETGLRLNLFLFPVKRIFFKRCVDCVSLWLSINETTETLRIDFTAPSFHLRSWLSVTCRLAQVLAYV